MRKLLLLLVLAGLIAASTVHASCPSYGGYGGSYWGGRTTFGSYYPGYGYVPSYRVRTAKCVIREVRDDGSLRVWDEGDGQEHVVNLHDKAVLRARHKKDFDGRRQLDRSDLRAGQRIAVTALKRSGDVLKVRVIRHSEKAPQDPMLDQIRAGSERTITVRSALD